MIDQTMMELHVCNRHGTVLRSFALGDRPEVIIGRDESCDLPIRSISISREHCLIERQGDGLVLHDLGSTGGTFVDGSKVDSIRIVDGLEARIGPAILRFVEGGR